MYRRGGRLLLADWDGASPGNTCVVFPFAAFTFWCTRPAKLDEVKTSIPFTRFCALLRPQTKELPRPRAIYTRRERERKGIYWTTPSYFCFCPRWTGWKLQQRGGKAQFCLDCYKDHGYSSALLHVIGHAAFDPKPLELF